MEDGYITTKNSEQYLRNALLRFLERADVSARNKELVATYLRESGLGKTARGRAKTKIGYARRVSYLNSLDTLVTFVQKDLEKVEQQDMELFIEALEEGRIKSRKRFVTGKGYFRSGAALSDRYIVDIKVNIRRYYKYLLGNCQTYPPLVDWIDVSLKQKQIQALTEQEVQQLVDRARTARDRALVQVLFDGGFRLGELLNIRLRHVTFKEVDQGQRCFFLHAPYSKTFPRTVVLPMPESTKWLTYWLREHPARPQINADGTLKAEDLSAQLFPLTATRVEMIVPKLGEEALGKHVWPHLMRHTSATYWANKLPYFKFCKRFGWTMTSKMPQKYIDAAGVDEIDAARIYHLETRGRQAQQDDLRRRLVRAMETVLDPEAEQGPPAGDQWIRGPHEKRATERPGS